MSELRINNITDTAGSSGPIIAGVSTVTSTSHMVMPSGPTEMRGGRRGKSLKKRGSRKTKKSRKSRKSLKKNRKSRRTRRR